MPSFEFTVVPSALVLLSLFKFPFSILVCFVSSVICSLYFIFSGDFFYL